MAIRITDESWFSRLGGAFRGVVVGGVVLLASIPVLFVNEGRAVKTSRALTEGQGAVVKVDSASVSPEHEGKFVHLSGAVTTSDVLRDDDLGVEFNGLRLQRHVEMYQWTEATEKKTKKKIGGRKQTITTFSYEKTWSDKVIDSTTFEEAKKHPNPTQMLLSERQVQANDVSLGEFKLTESLVNQISDPQPIELDESQLPAALAGATVATDGLNGSHRIYFSPNGGDPVQAPQVGDIRVWVTATKATDASIMSRQVGTSFEPYKTGNGTELDMAAMGIVSPELMFAHAQEANTALTWGLRFVGAGMMFFGCVLILRPLAVIGDVVPFIGSIVEVGASAVAGIVAAVGSLLIISVAWLFYRPLIAIPLLAISIGLSVVLFRKIQAAKNKSATDAETASELNAPSLVQAH